MYYINDADYEYISNKYHDTKKFFDSDRRFTYRRDEIFSNDTGMDADAIKAGILENDKQHCDLPHPIRKAYAFSYVLENTRISCDSRDRFPAINAIDRPLNATIVKIWHNEVFEEIIPETGKKRDFLENAGIATLWPDYDHSVPIWERILRLGFKGLLSASEKIRSKKVRTEDEDAFFEGIKITYTAILAFIERLARLAEQTAGSERMAKALRNIKDNPPATFYEALLVDYLYFMFSEHIEGLQVRSLGQFDRYFYDFYKKDLENGITEEEIRTDLAYFFMQFTAIGNYWNQPISLGGCKENDETLINELSYICLDVYDKMGIYNPKILIKIAESTPKDFILKALDMIRRGHSCIALLSDDTIRKGLMRSGASEEQARLSDIKGCYENAEQGAMDCGMNYINMMKPLEYALHKGCDGVTGTFAGLASPSLDFYRTFEDFYEEYKKQLLFLIDTSINVVNEYEEYLSYVNPQSLLSATYPTCLEKASDALHGGAVTNNSELSLGYTADIADSLTNIKKYVFDKKELTLSELVNMLDNNFEGNEPIRKKLLADPDKYGNNKELPDSFATELVDMIANYVCQKTNSRGGKWQCGFHVARMSYVQGEKTASAPNGRLLGEELSKNHSASMGQNREGATAAILSITKIDATAFVGDSALDLGLLPSAVKGDDGLEAMYGLVMTFIKRGGYVIQMNVFNAETLREAQKYPEKYQDLQIRVCGWNVLWNNINKKEQDGFIRQAESLI